MVLAEKSRKQKYTATLLPIRTVGVQVGFLLFYLLICFYLDLLFIQPFTFRVTSVLTAMLWA